MITLATLPKATAQEVYDQVKEHLLKQNQRSYRLQAQCAYRGKDGLKCAAGCLISDEEYKPIFDSLDIGTSWYDLVAEGFVPSEHKDLITSLQQVHDDAEVEDWESHLQKVAEIYNLKP